MELFDVKHETPFIRTTEISDTDREYDRDCLIQIENLTEIVRYRRRSSSCNKYFLWYVRKCSYPMWRAYGLWRIDSSVPGITEMCIKQNLARF